MLITISRLCHHLEAGGISHIIIALEFVSIYSMCLDLH